MKLWKIMLAVIVAVLMISCVAMAEECEHECDWYSVTKSVDFCKGVAVVDRYCGTCNAKVEEGKIDYIEERHMFGAEYDKTAATCTKAATFKIKCDLCGKVETVTDGEKLGHKWGAAVTVEATCTEHKYTYRPCERGCGEITDKTVASGTKLGHNFQWVTTKPATCTEKGETTKKCINKGCTEIAPIDKPVEEIKALGHDRDSGKIVTQPTCTEKGLERWSCKTCKVVLQEKEIDAKGHVKVETVTGVVVKQPSCTETGLKTWTCTACKTHILHSEVLDKTPCKAADIIAITISAENCAVYEHKYSGVINQCTKCFHIHSGAKKADYNVSVVAKAPTCEEDGYTAHLKCSVCGAKNKDYELKEKLGHEFFTAEQVISNAKYAKTRTLPTCEKDGKAEVYCKHSGCTETPEIVLPATGHKLGGWNYNGYECDKGTIAWRVCENKRCDDREKTYEEKMVQLPGKHDWKVMGGTLPTCTTYGIVDYRCYICGAESWDNYVPATGHTLIEKVTEPTCTKAGKKVVTCEDCDLKETVKLEATGHLETKDVVTKEPTCTEKGAANVVCVACETVLKTKEIAALGHGATKDVETKAPTCTEKGAANVVCTVCDAVVGTKEIAALGHGTTKDVETKAATCTEKGSINVICTVCDAVVGTKEIAALGHGATKEVVAKEAACEVAGSIDVICTVCDAKIAEKSIEALKHEYSWNVVTKPSPAGNGKNEYSCALCGNVAKVETVKYVKWYYNNTMTAFGPMTKELVGGNDWYRVTPVDLTVDGVYTYDLIASNKYIVGTVTITVNAGTLTVSYKTKANVDVKDEALLIYASKADLATGTAVTAPVGAAINAAETFGADTKVLVSLILTGDYDAAGKGLVDASAAAGMIANID